jgi:hypothetical protein
LSLLNAYVRLVEVKDVTFSLGVVVAFVVLNTFVEALYLLRTADLTAIRDSVVIRFLSYV